MILENLMTARDWDLLSDDDIDAMNFADDANGEWFKCLACHGDFPLVGEGFPGPNGYGHECRNCHHERTATT